MSKYEVVITVETREEAHIVRRIVEQVHNSLREESRGLEEGIVSDRILTELGRIRDVTRRGSNGTFTITFEESDE